MAINLINNVNNDDEMIDLTSNEDNQIITSQLAFNNLANRDNLHRVIEDTIKVNVDEHPKTYEDLTKQLLRLFECPVCLKHIIPPISQCLIGHLICSKCISKCENCPFCRSPFNAYNNLFMEKVGLLINFPCTNTLNGCKAQLTVNQKEIHERQCCFLPYQCFFINCKWKGIYSEISEHMCNIHSHRLLRGSDQCFDILLDKIYTPYNWLLFYHNQYFAVTFHSNRYLQIQVNLIGPAIKSKEYKFSVTLTQQLSQNLSKRLVYEKPILPYTQMNEISYHKGLIKNVFSLPSEVIEPFIKKRPRRLPIVLNIYPVPSS